MPSSFNPTSGNYSSFYAGSMAPPMKLPNGQYVAAPNTMSVPDMYAGIYPPPAPPNTALTSRSVATVPVDRFGNPVPIPAVPGAPLYSTPTMADTRGEQSGSRYAPTQGVQQAGTTTMPPGVRPQSIDRAYAQMGIQPSGGLGRGPGRSQVAAAPTIHDPFNTYNEDADQSRLPPGIPNPEEAGFLQTFFPNRAQNPALGAIDQLTGSGRSTASPMPLPFFRQPTYTPPVDVTIKGKNKTFPIPLTPSSKLRAGAPAAPRMAAPPPLPASYTIRSGDTLTSLAKRFGTTVGQLANANGISNPNKIRAGSSLSLNFMAPPVPRMPPGGGPSPQASPAQQAAAKQSWDKYFNRDRQLAEGRSSQLDEFGNIR